MAGISSYHFILFGDMLFSQCWRRTVSGKFERQLNRKLIWIHLKKKKSESLSAKTETDVLYADFVYPAYSDFSFRYTL